MVKLVAFGFLLIVAGCAVADVPAEREGPLVVSTVAPIVDMVAQVLGGRGEVVGLVPRGVDSHTHELRPGGC